MGGGVPPSSGHGVGVRVEQCVLGVDGIEGCVSAHGSKFNDAVVALIKAGGFGINDHSVWCSGSGGLLKAHGPKPKGPYRHARLNAIEQVLLQSWGSRKSDVK